MNARTIALLAFFCLFGGTHFALSGSLSEGFLNPPQDARPQVWYHLMNGNVSKEGITRDFEAMAKVGIGGVQMVDVGGLGIPEGELHFNTPEWFDMLRHAAGEARRLGLEVTLPSCSGWSCAGGPWITPDKGMKIFTTSCIDAEGGGPIALTLPRQDHGSAWYRDVAVVAFPVPAAELVVGEWTSRKDPDGSIVFFSVKPFRVPTVAYDLVSEKWAWNANADIEVSVSEDGVRFHPTAKILDTVRRQGIADRATRFHAAEDNRMVRAVRIRLVRSDPELGKTFLDNVRLTYARRLAQTGAKTLTIRTSITPDTAPVSSDAIVRPETVRDISKCLKGDTLTWDAPPGRWRFLRIGTICNGRLNHPASRFGSGLEVDKLSASAVDFHFESYIGRVCRETAASNGGKPGIAGILIDSYEVGSQNWTEGFEKEFARRTGYGMVPWYPVLTGHVVESAAASERFLEDFRHVIADLFTENFAGEMARKCHEYGLTCSIEPYGNGPFDDFAYGKAADIPMAEFWCRNKNSFQSAGRNDVRNCISAGYLAHVWGRRFAAAEAFTSKPPNTGRWMSTPYSIKCQGDFAYCAGINLIVYHRFCHQPWADMYFPGMTMGHYGMHMDRTETWWDISDPWLSYQSRCQWMLQEGIFAADALFLASELSPDDGGNPYGRRTGSEVRWSLPEGYRWDIASADVVHSCRVENGNVVVPGGVAYRLLILASVEAMSERLCSRVRELQREGATVVIPVRPVRAPGLVGYPRSDGRVRRLCEEIVRHGALSCTPQEALEREKIDQDAIVVGDLPKDVEWDFIHRRAAEADWYFIAASTRKEGEIDFSFRQTGKVPELWDPETGEIKDAQSWCAENGRTRVRIPFRPSGSVFVVFRRPADGATQGAMARSANPAPAVEASVSGPWTVSFPAHFAPNKIAHGPDEIVEFPALTDWTEMEREEVRHFSGTAVYRKQIDFSPWMAEKKAGRRVFLDLGEVCDFAQVEIGTFSGHPLWRPPFRMEITDALDGNVEELLVKVTNLWPNRLIGDDAKPPDCNWKSGSYREGIAEIPDWVKEGKPSPTGRFTFTTWRHWHKDDKLFPSGLLGPVRIWSESEGNRSLKRQEEKESAP